MEASKQMEGALRILGIQSQAQLARHEELGRKRCKQVHPDKFHTEETQKGKTALLQEVLEARELVRANLDQARVSVQVIEDITQARDGQSEPGRVCRVEPPHPRTPPESLRALPAGWTQWWDKKYKQCFFHQNATGHTQWHWPE